MRARRNHRSPVKVCGGGNIVQAAVIGGEAGAYSYLKGGIPKAGQNNVV